MPETPVFNAAVPVLRVADVARSIAFYRDVLGFTADPFPVKPPILFAILRQGSTEIMLRLDPTARRGAGSQGWDLYLRLGSPSILSLQSAIQAAGLPILRLLERMPYPQVEFEIEDPDGYRVCIARAVEG